MPTTTETQGSSSGAVPATQDLTTFIAIGAALGCLLLTGCIVFFAVRWRRRSLTGLATEQTGQMHLQSTEMSSAHSMRASVGNYGNVGDYGELELKKPDYANFGSVASGSASSGDYVVMPSTPVAADR
jgi:hypothetical protein